jgi:hypothetical protein
MQASVDSGGDRRGDLVRGKREREVPGHDRAAHADGLAHHEAVGRRVGELHVLAMDLVRQVGEPRDVLAEAPGFEPRLEDRLALLLRKYRRDLLDFSEHVLRGLVQDLAPLVGGKLRPGRERLVSRLRRLVDIRRPAGRHLVDDCTCRRVADLIRFA